MLETRSVNIAGEMEANALRCLAEFGMNRRVEI